MFKLKEHNIITFLITYMFDTLGTLTAVEARANLFQESSSKDKALEKTLEADAVATVTGSLLGVSTVTSFIESVSGIEAGGRTGLAAVFAAHLFTLTLFMLPLFKAIPEPAILPILLVAGILMFKELGRINFENMDIAAAFVTYTTIKIAQGKFKDLNIGVIVISLIVFIVHK